MGPWCGLGGGLICYTTPQIITCLEGALCSEVGRLGRNRAWETLGHVCRRHLNRKGTGVLPCPRVFEGVVVVRTHTYFAESPLILVWTGTAKPGPPSVSGTDTTILAGIWSARWKHCENRKWDPEGMLGGGVTRLVVAHSSGHPLLNHGTP